MDIPEDPGLRETLAVALKFLERRERFTQEIERHLRGRGFDAEKVRGVLDLLAAARLVDDARAVEEVVTARSARRSVGKKKLRADLARRGAPDGLIEAKLAERDDAHEVEAARQALASRTWRPESRARAGRFLFARGFDPEQIESALDRHFGEDGEAANS